MIFYLPRPTRPFKGLPTGPSWASRTVNAAWVFTLRILVRLEALEIPMGTGAQHNC